MQRTHLLPLFIALSLIAHIGLLCGIENTTKSFINHSKNQGHELKGLITVRIQEHVKKTAGRQKSSSKLSSKKLSPMAAHSQRKQQEPNLFQSAKGQANKGETGLTARYLSQIRESIEKSKYKSPLAQRLRLKGSVGLSFKILWPNQIKEIKIIDSSRHKALDYSALKSIESIKEIPHMPQAISQDVLAVNLRLVYE